MPVSYTHLDVYKRQPNRGYTVSSTSSATKLDLAPKETPQSITTFTAQQIQDQGLLTVGEVLDLSLIHI